MNPKELHGRIAWKASKMLQQFLFWLNEKLYKDSKSSTSIGMSVPCWITDCLLAGQEGKQKQQLCTAALTRLWDKHTLLSTHTSGLLLPFSHDLLCSLFSGGALKTFMWRYFCFPCYTTRLTEQKDTTLFLKLQLGNRCPPFLTLC